MDSAEPGEDTADEVSSPGPAYASGLRWQDRYPMTDVISNDHQDRPLAFLYPIPAVRLLPLF